MDEGRDRPWEVCVQPIRWKEGSRMFKVVREYAKFALSALSSVMYHTT